MPFCIVASDSIREYNRIMKQRQRQRDKELEKAYQDPNVFGISFTEFVEQQKLSTWKKISITLSDDELKMARLAFKLSDEQLRKLMKGGT